MLFAQIFPQKREKNPQSGNSGRRFVNGADYVAAQRNGHRTTADNYPH